MPLFVKIKADAPFCVKFSEYSPYFPRKAASPTRPSASDWAITVSDTGFSVTLTEKSVAQTVVTEGIFAPPSRRRASICAAAAVHVIDHKTHVLRTVCKNQKGQRR